MRSVLDTAYTTGGWCAEKKRPSSRKKLLRISGWGIEDIERTLKAFKLPLNPYVQAVYFPPGFSREAARQAGASMGRAPLTASTR
jgi:hypothetical protein